MVEECGRWPMQASTLMFHSTIPKKNVTSGRPEALPKSGLGSVCGQGDVQLQRDGHGSWCSRLDC